MSFNPDSGKIAGVEAITPIEKINDLTEFSLDDVDFKEIEERASIFVREAKFLPTDSTVKLVSVEEDGKLIYENDGRRQLANSQYDLAEGKEYKPEALGLLGFFGKSKIFGKKDDNQFV